MNSTATRTVTRTAYMMEYVVVFDGEPIRSKHLFRVPAGTHIGDVWGTAERHLEAISNEEGSRLIEVKHFPAEDR